MRLILGAETPGKLDDIWILFKEAGSFSAASYIALGYLSYDVYIVGGGGVAGRGGIGSDSGLYRNGGGGGGGGGGGFNKQLNTSLAALPGTSSIVVGLGGIEPAPAGKESSFNTLKAFGGGGGGKGSNSNASDNGYGGSGGAGGGISAVGANGAVGVSTGAVGPVGSLGGGKGANGIGLPLPGPKATPGSASGSGFGGGGGGGGGRGIGPNNASSLASANDSAGGYNSLGGVQSILKGSSSEGWAGLGGGGGGGTDLTQLTGQLGLSGDGNSLLPGGGGRGSYGQSSSFAGFIPASGAPGCVLIRLYS